MNEIVIQMDSRQMESLRAKDATTWLRLVREYEHALEVLG